MSEQITSSPNENNNNPRGKDEPAGPDSDIGQIGGGGDALNAPDNDIDVTLVEVQNVGNEEKSEERSATGSRAAFAQEALRVIKKGAVKVREGTKTVRQEADRLVGKSREIYRHPPEWVMEPFRRQHKYKPAVDFVIKQAAYEILVELPGVKKQSIGVKLAGGQITINGEKRNEDTGESDNGYLVHELHFGAFERTLPVPKDADPGRVEARFENGVLTLKLPKLPSALVPDREIEILSS